MALARIKTWVSEILKSADLNAEFNNLLNNPITLISPTTGAINFNLQAHTNFIAQTFAVDPTSTGAGRIMFNTARTQFQVDDGTIIRAVPTVSATALTAGDILIVTSSATSQFNRLGIGSSGQVLTVTSSNSAPAWSASAAAVTGIAAVRGFAGKASTSDATGSYELTQADYVQLRSTSGAFYVSTGSTGTFRINLNTTFSLTQNGQVSSSALVGTNFYHLYYASTGGTTLYGAASTVSPAAGGLTTQLSAGISHFAYAGSVYCSTSTTLLSQTMRGASMAYDAGRIATSQVNSTAETTVSLTSQVPSHALMVDGHIACLLVPASVAFATLRTVSGTDYWKSKTIGAASNHLLQTNVRFPNVGQQIFCLLSTQTASAGDSLQIDIHGYTVGNGDA